MTLKKGIEMEENKENNVVTPTTETQENGGQEQKTFTQEELNTIVETRLAKAKKDMPSKEELKKYNEWKEAQKTEQEKMAEKEAEYQKALAEKEQIINENKILKSGVNAEDTDYVLFKVTKMEGDFEENLSKFLKDNPKFLNKTVPSKATGVETRTTSQSNEDDGVMAILKSKHPNIEF